MNDSLHEMTAPSIPESVVDSATGQRTIFGVTPSICFKESEGTDMKMIFILMQINSLKKKGCALSLVLKVRVWNLEMAYL